LLAIASRQAVDPATQNGLDRTEPTHRCPWAYPKIELLLLNFRRIDQCRQLSLFFCEQPNKG
jgi:hypothetical protein